jgi:hypothetical protein
VQAAPWSSLLVVAVAVTPSASRRSSQEASTSVQRTASVAGALYLALWNRADTDELAVEGDGDVLGRFFEGVRIR